MLSLSAMQGQCNRMHSFGKQLSVVEEVKRKERLMQSGDPISCTVISFLFIFSLEPNVRASSNDFVK